MKKFQATKCPMFYFLVALALMLSEITATANAYQENEEAAGEAVKEIIHVVKKGETLCKIGRIYNVTADSIFDRNMEIKNPNRIFVGQTIIINLSNVEVVVVRKIKKIRRGRSLQNAYAEEWKIGVLKDVAARTGIPWEILAGLSKQESGFGRHLVGDRGKSHGPFQIHLPAHPEVSIHQAMDWEWSANWAADYLVSLGANQNLFRALRLWNGSIRNPKTFWHAKNVLHHARNTFGFES